MRRGAQLWINRENGGLNGGYLWINMWKLWMKGRFGLVLFTAAAAFMQVRAGGCPKVLQTVTDFACLETFLLLY